jgi:hypothetical protein
MCRTHFYVKSSLLCEVSNFLFNNCNRVVLVSAVAYKENFDNNKSMLLPEADAVPTEADGDTGGFDLRRYRARHGRDLSCSIGAGRALARHVAVGRGLSR